MGEPLQQPFIHQNALVETDRIGEGTRIWAFAHVQAGVTIGSNCNIGDHAFVERGVTLGNNVTIKNGVCIWEHVEVADNVFLGPNVVLTNDLTPRSRAADWIPVQTHIEEGVSVGANATIVCGIRLGRRALIGAGAVVTRDVRPYELVYGNPATHRGWVCFCGTPLQADTTATTDCRRCARKYQITDAGVEEIG
jgi:acetyltransferase-like isoleucine patch superfamily enzyme